MLIHSVMINSVIYSLILLSCIVAGRTVTAFVSPAVTATATHRLPTFSRICDNHSQCSASKKNLHDGDGDSDASGGLSRRQFAELSVAGVGLSVSFLGTRETTPTDYGLWGILPVGTYKQKQTLQREIVPGQIWTLDQKFGILNVQVPLRTTIVKLSGGGGLFLYNPVAATPEVVQMIQTLVAEHGPLKHIVVGSVALEHKAYAGVLAQKFLNAQVWLTPGQYSFPVNLSDPFLGFPSSRTRNIPTPENAPEDWKQDFDFLTLGPLISRYVNNVWCNHALDS
jgi:Domain of unknown function (DUF4336)